jgi:mannose-6-phosphate isomerase-like protein (cupin superfamily)
MVEGLKGACMPPAFTYKKLTEVEDSAPKFGHGDVQEARFATGDLEAERTGVSLLGVAPGKRQGFAHRHDEAEEVYVVISGSGRVKLDDEIVELAPLDAIRVAPAVTRCFEAGDEGLKVLAVGARHEGDGEIVPGWWTD